MVSQYETPGWNRHYWRVLVSHELAWCAGFYDGEGSSGFYKSRNNPGRVQMTATQNDRSVLDRMQAALGGRVRGPYARVAAKPQWTWAAESMAAFRQAMALMWPWLGDIKREQMATALERHYTAKELRRTDITGVA